MKDVVNWAGLLLLALEHRDHWDHRHGLLEGLECIRSLQPVPPLAPFFLLSFPQGLPSVHAPLYVVEVFRVEALLCLEHQDALEVALKQMGETCGVVPEQLIDVTQVFQLVQIP